MAMTKDLDPRTKAQGRWLSALITASQWRNAAEFQREMGRRGVRLDYTNLTKKLAGKLPIPTEELLPMIDALNVSYVDFIKQSMEWLERQSKESL